jgi:hypothetical protein
MEAKMSTQGSFLFSLASLVSEPSQGTFRCPTQPANAVC